MNLAQPIVLFSISDSSALGYILYLNALFLFSVIFLTLAFYVFFDNVQCYSAGAHKAETLTPEILFPQFLTYFREFYLDKSAACALKCVDKLLQFRIGVSRKKDMVMIPVMVPFSARDIV